MSVDSYVNPIDVPLPSPVTEIIADPISATEYSQMIMPQVAEADDDSYEMDEYLEDYAYSLVQGREMTTQGKKKKKPNKGKNDDNKPKKVKANGRRTEAPTFVPTPERVPANNGGFLRQPLTIPFTLYTCLLEVLPQKAGQNPPPRPGRGKKTKPKQKRPGQKKKKRNRRALAQGDGQTFRNVESPIEGNGSSSLKDFIRSNDGVDGDDNYDEIDETFTNSYFVQDDTEETLILSEEMLEEIQRMLAIPTENRFGWDAVGVRSMIDGCLRFECELFRCVCILSFLHLATESHYTSLVFFFHQLSNLSRFAIISLSIQQSKRPLTNKQTD